ncbi:class II D-tagatose-bisphosphate aldolase non-catalytic subunit [Candidatus Pelagibacter bacterium nBUS_27]|uniref:class II D-tagatose-bisphosphate aldolase non-catalytic subunit n=1 Tax=Candidatus Pelagibacter bacterium nBUS_27 TaxID=3374188 RepID=UPI003EB92165
MKILNDILLKKNSTLLGVGPMSLNCVNATIELANDNNVPLMMIASRRQIDSEKMGGGYVNNWTTEKFSNYVSDKDRGSKIILSRDHGGPYQNNIEYEKNYNIEDAMNSAKDSFEVDIKNGFKIIHIDPSIDPSGNLNTETILERLKELYVFCIETAKKYEKKIQIEIGTEEQSGGTNTLEELKYSLDEITNFCKKNNYIKPFFVVVQTGTKVMETKNIGIFKGISDKFEQSKIPSLISLCEKYEINIKQHNTDYLDDDFLSKHPSFRIHAANVAPEYGVAETKKLFEIMEEYNLNKLKNEFIEQCVSSNKWVKWVIDEKKIDDYDKSIICGHYIFSTDNFLQLKERLISDININRVEFDNILKDAVKSSIARYMKCFNLLTI